MRTILLLDEPTNDLDLAGLEPSSASSTGTTGASHGLARPCLSRAHDRHRRARGGDAPGPRVRGRLERVRGRARPRPRARRGRLPPLLRRARSHRGAGAHHAAVEERGYGQGRKKKKTKDVAKQFEKKLGKAGARREAVEPVAPRAGARTDAPGRDVVARLERAVVENGTFRLAPVDLRDPKRGAARDPGTQRSGQVTLLHALTGDLPLAEGRRCRPRRRPRRLPRGRGPSPTSARYCLVPSELGSRPRRATGNGLSKFASAPTTSTSQVRSPAPPGARRRATSPSLTAPRSEHGRPSTSRRIQLDPGRRATGGAFAASQARSRRQPRPPLPRSAEATGRSCSESVLQRRRSRCRRVQQRLEVPLAPLLPRRVELPTHEVVETVRPTERRPGAAPRRRSRT